jgi:hypothetical protein
MSKSHLERYGAHPMAPTDSQIGRKSTVIVIKLPGRARLGIDRPASELVTHMRTHQRFQNGLFISRLEFLKKKFGIGIGISQLGTQPWSLM